MRGRTSALPGVTVSLLALLMVGSCSVFDGSADAQGNFTAGTGSFVYDGAEEITGRSIRVWYSAPASDLDTAEILIVVHGHERNAEDYRDAWLPHIEGRNVLLLVPEFPADEFSDTAYNLGNMVDDDGDERPEDEWTFAVIEALFDHARKAVDSQAEEYVMFGHSAGAQFVHRFVEFGSPVHLRRAVVANAGWYTLPDDSVDFPYGLDGVSADEEDMEAAFGTDLVVMLGADDVDPDAESLRRSEEADDQGEHRLERGLNFYLAARQSAGDQDLAFAWRLQVVPGIGHSYADMAEAAAPVLLGGS